MPMKWLRSFSPRNSVEALTSSAVAPLRCLSGDSSAVLDSILSPNVMAAILVLLAFVYSTFWVVLPRMRDLSMRPFWLILLLVPGIDVGFGLVLLFRPSAIALPRCE